MMLMVLQPMAGARQVCALESTRYVSTRRAPTSVSAKLATTGTMPDCASVSSWGLFQPSLMKTMIMMVMGVVIEKGTGAGVGWYLVSAKLAATGTQPDSVSVSS